MIFTLHRYIFRDLLRVFFLATAILSVVLGLGVMLRPLRDFSINPAQVPELILCTFPISLTIVIPVAALLATTLTYGKLAFDNEINACRSNGISLMTLIYPAITLALMVGVISLLLAFHVIPYFIEKFESIIKSDAEAIIYRNIERQGTLSKGFFPGVKIHVDHADRNNKILYGVTVLRLGDKNKINEIITAEKVQVQFTPNKDRIMMRPINAKIATADGSYGGLADITLGYPIPSFWKDEIKFKNLADLKAIETDMTTFTPIREGLNKFRKQWKTEVFFLWCQEQLQKQGFVDLYHPNGNYRLRIHADNCQFMAAMYNQNQSKPLPRGNQDSSKNQTARLTFKNHNPVTIEHFRSSEVAPDRIFSAPDVNIKVSPFTQPALVTIYMQDTSWKYANRPEIYHPGPYDLPTKLPDNINQAAQQISLTRDILPAELKHPVLLNTTSQHLMKSFRNLRKQCHELHSEIIAEEHYRLAFGVCCVALTLMGAALGIVFRSSHLLAAFGISFIPATICMTTIFTGQHIAEKSIGNMSGGLAFLWSGVIVISIADILIYKFVIKH